MQLINSISLLDLWAYLFDNNKDFETRYIEYEKKTSTWGSEITNYKSRNSVLQKAITLYLSRMGLKLEKSRVELTQKEEKSDYYGGSSGSSAADQLKAYELVQHPLQGVWINIEEGLQFMRTNRKVDPQGDSKNDEKKKNNFNTEVICFTIQCKKKNGGRKRIDEWIDKVYTWYVDELKKNEDKGRFMYLRSNESNLGGDDGGGQDADVASYKRYRLSDHKTFESLFFPERDRLLTTLGLFSRKEGKYGITGRCTCGS